MLQRTPQSADVRDIKIFPTAHVLAVSSAVLLVFEIVNRVLKALAPR